jgi:ribosomal protein S18 acetylase RimI-like enzyme
MINYTKEMKCSKTQLADLFLKVGWNSGKYPDRLYEAIKNSAYKIFVYDDNKLIGMISALSDGCINLFISYLVIDPAYQKQRIGTTLLNKLLSIGNFNRVELITDEKDKDFYLKNDFTEDGVGMFKVKW